MSVNFILPTYSTSFENSGGDDDEIIQDNRKKIINQNDYFDLEKNKNEFKFFIEELK